MQRHQDGIEAVECTQHGHVERRVGMACEADEAALAGLFCRYERFERAAGGQDALDIALTG